MKKKLLFVLIAFASLGTYSCAEEDVLPTTNEPVNGKQAEDKGGY